MDLSDSAAFYYEHDDYKKSIDCYEKILKEGKESWKLFYNLGNAYYKDGKIGMAILNYEKAKKLNPTEQDILNNLSIVEDKIIDKIKMKEISLEKEIKNMVVYKFSTTGWAWISILTLAFCLILLFSYLISKNSNLKRISFWGSAIIFILFVFSIVFGYAELNDKNSMKMGIVTGKEINLYTKPKADETSKKNLVLHEGTRVRILERNSDWLNIQLSNGNEGWVQENSVGLY